MKLLAVAVIIFGVWMSTHNDGCRRSLTFPVIALGGFIFLMWVYTTFTIGITQQWFLLMFLFLCVCVYLLFMKCLWSDAFQIHNRISWRVQEKCGASLDCILHLPCSVFCFFCWKLLNFNLPWHDWFSFEVSCRAPDRFDRDSCLYRTGVSLIFLMVNRQNSAVESLKISAFVLQVHCNKQWFWPY